MKNVIIKVSYAPDENAMREAKIFYLMCIKAKEQGECVAQEGGTK